MRAANLLGCTLVLTSTLIVGCAEPVSSEAPATDPAADADAPEPGEELGVGGAAVDDTVVATALVDVGPLVKLATPEPGTGAGYVVHWGDGSSESSMIEAGHDGTLTRVAETPAPDAPNVEGGSANATGSAASRAAPPACADKAYSLTGFHWAKPYAWSFTSASTPSAISIAKVEAALKRAASNVTTGRNDCKRTSHVTASHRYVGRTKSKPNIRVSGTNVICDTTDGKSVVGFGPLPGKVLAITCFSWSVVAGQRLGFEADVRIDSERRWFTTTSLPAGCSNRYMIEGTMTHEFGHAFGLGHVSEAAHGNLTMSTRAMPCTTRDATLGLGDVLGLEKLY